MNFPTDDLTRLTHDELNPFQDSNGKPWTWNPDKQRWSPFLTIPEVDNAAVLAALGYATEDSIVGSVPVAALLGESGSVEAIPTTELPTSRVIGVVLDGRLSFYQLQAGTDDTTTPGTIRPNDYHATTNTRIWRQVL